MHGLASASDALALVLAALRQRGVLRLGSRDRVVEERLVEIAHPVEQQGVGMPALDVQIPSHDRGLLRARQRGLLRNLKRPVSRENESGTLDEILSLLVIEQTQSGYI